MIIARILGTVVSSQKDERLLGKKLLIVRPVNVDGSDTTGYVVAVDTVGAGYHERVLVVAGSSARLAQSCFERRLVRSAWRATPARSRAEAGGGMLRPAVGSAPVLCPAALHAALAGRLPASAR